jgi:hypothetical protein
MDDAVHERGRHVHPYPAIPILPCPHAPAWGLAPCWHAHGRCYSTTRGVCVVFRTGISAPADPRAHTTVSKRAVTCADPRAPDKHTRMRTHARTQGIKETETKRELWPLLLGVFEPGASRADKVCVRVCVRVEGDARRALRLWVGWCGTARVVRPPPPPHPSSPHRTGHTSGRVA